MKHKSFSPGVNSSVALLAAFVAGLFYNGPGHSLHWLSISTALLLAWWIAHIARLDLTRPSIAVGWLPGLALLYLCWLVIEPLLSTYPYASLSIAMQLVALPLAMLGWLISPHEDRAAGWRLAQATLLIAGLTFGLWGIADYVVLKTRAHGPLIDANAFGALMNLFLIPAAFSFLTAPVSGRGIDDPRLALGVVGVLAAAEFMSQSRGGLLALLVTVPWLLWFARTGPAFRTRWPWLLSVLVVAYLFVRAGPFEQQRGIESLVLATDQQLEADAAFSARLLMWKSTWRIIEDSNLIVGTGLGTYRSYYAGYREETETSGNLAHNDYLQGLQEGGLIQLGFLLIFTIIAPLWLLQNRARAGRGPRAPPSNDTAGLMLAVLCVSLHATINFVHYVAPVALLTGLYLAHSWEATKEARKLPLPSTRALRVKPGFLKTAAILLLAIPIGGLVIDGAIFTLFSGRDPVVNRLDANARLTARNVALMLRPGNPFPRLSLINDLIVAAHLETSPEVRATLLETAEREALYLADCAPGLPSGRFLAGKVRALKGTPGDLALARADLEYAVRRVPPATGMRLELIKVYRQLGQTEEAYRSVVAAKKWVVLESDLPSLANFAREARTIALAHGDRDEADYWNWVQDRLAAGSG